MSDSGSVDAGLVVPSPGAEFDVLHAVRVRGAVSAEHLESVAPAGTIDRLVEGGLVRVTARGHALTAAGFAAHAGLLEDERESTDQAVLAAAYARFLAVNAPVKAACSAWQASGGGPEDVFVVLDALRTHLSRVSTGLSRAGALLPRFAAYLQGSTDALDHVRDGDARYVTDLGVASFHTVWFECHEDFLLTLGRSREDEERHG